MFGLSENHVSHYTTRFKWFTKFNFCFCVAEVELCRYNITPIPFFLNTWIVVLTVFLYLGSLICPLNKKINFIVALIYFTTTFFDTARNGQK